MPVLTTSATCSYIHDLDAALVRHTLEGTMMTEHTVLFEASETSVLAEGTRNKKISTPLYTLHLF